MPEDPFKLTTVMALSLDVIPALVPMALALYAMEAYTLELPNVIVLLFVLVVDFRVEIPAAVSAAYLPKLAMCIHGRSVS